MKNIQAVKIWVEEVDDKFSPHGDPQERVYEIESRSNLRNHKFDLIKMRDMFDTPLGQIFPERHDA